MKEREAGLEGLAGDMEGVDLVQRPGGDDMVRFSFQLLLWVGVMRHGQEAHGSVDGVRL